MTFISEIKATQTFSFNLKAIFQVFIFSQCQLLFRLIVLRMSLKTVNLSLNYTNTYSYEP